MKKIVKWYLQRFPIGYPNISKRTKHLRLARQQKLYLLPPRSILSGAFLYHNRCNKHVFLGKSAHFIYPERKSDIFKITGQICTLSIIQEKTEFIFYVKGKVYEKKNNLYSNSSHAHRRRKSVRLFKKRSRNQSGRNGKYHCIRKRHRTDGNTG